ncbi:MAG: hypothetical protein KKH60_11880, partial [Proteobacteria bacterium]|nr:hypothetical protein [Pseudomonadota bacterium]
SSWNCKRPVLSTSLSCDHIITKELHHVEKFILQLSEPKTRIEACEGGKQIKNLLFILKELNVTA